MIDLLQFIIANPFPSEDFLTSPQPSPLGEGVIKGKIVCGSLRKEYDIKNFKLCETLFLCEKFRTSPMSHFLKGTIRQLAEEGF
jgi:hypothetical protein